MDIVSYLLAKNSGGGGGSSVDWSAIGYEGTPQSVIDGYNYALEIKNNWVPNTSLAQKFMNNYTLMFMPLVDTSTATTMQSMFQNCYSLLKIPILNTSKVSAMQGMFNNCNALKDVPVFDTSSLKSSNSMQSMFVYCYSLTDESVDNILQMCIGATSYTGTKTLAKLGFGSNYYPATRIQALPHYQDFLDAGWTIGY